MDKPSDSIVSAQERAAMIREESERIEREQALVAEQQREHQKQVTVTSRQDEVKNVEIIASGETREHLLQRIRDLREDKPEPPAPEGFRSEGQIKEFNAEQEAGRAAVAKAQAEQERHRERWHEEAIAEQERTGRMEPVHHANPAQNQAYPVSKASFK